MLIMDKHISHTNLKLIEEEVCSRLDLLMLPSHIAHVLQPLNYRIFKPFNKYFKTYFDCWQAKGLTIGFGSFEEDIVRK